VWRSLIFLSAILTVTEWVLPAGASTLGPSFNSPQTKYDHVTFEKPTLAPMAYTLFCMRYKNECPRRMPAIVFRGGSRAMTNERRAQLREVNGEVNHAIQYEKSVASEPIERWQIAPERGICNDYAVTKRHELMKRGWPRRTLLLAEVSSGGSVNHTVLVVRTSEGDLVLDSVTRNIVRWSDTPYAWLRIQSPYHPRLWSRVGASQSNARDWRKEAARSKLTQGSQPGPD
jgi:predicted transglutaminase-like cysteine proteinase